MMRLKAIPVLGGKQETNYADLWKSEESHSTALINEMARQEAKRDKRTDRRTKGQKNRRKEEIGSNAPEIYRVPKESSCARLIASLAFIRRKHDVQLVVGKLGSLRDRQEALPRSSCWLDRFDRCPWQGKKARGQQRNT